MFEVTAKGPIFEISHKYVESPSAAQYAQHTHACCELLLFVQGDANFNIDGILHNPKPYDLLIIPQATYHYFIPRSPRAYENYVLDFSPDIIPIEHRQKLFAKPTILNIGEEVLAVNTATTASLTNNSNSHFFHNTNPPCIHV